MSVDLVGNVEATPEDPVPAEFANHEIVPASAVVIDEITLRQMGEGWTLSIHWVPRAIPGFPRNWELEHDEQFVFEKSSRMVKKLKEVLKKLEA